MIFLLVPVHIVQPLVIRLWHHTEKKHFSDRTVNSFVKQSVNTGIHRKHNCSLSYFDSFCQDIFRYSSFINLKILQLRLKHV